MSFNDRTDVPHHRASSHPASTCTATTATRYARISDETREVAVASADLAGDLLPAGWTAHATPAAGGGVYLLVLTPADGTARAQLIAPHAGHGWAIGITDPTDGTDTVLRTSDGDIAYQPTLAATIRAAVDALDTAGTNTPGPDRHARGAVHYLDSGCLIGVTDPHRPHLVHTRAVEHGGHPHTMLPTLRRVFAAGHDSADLGARLLAHDWDRLDPTTTVDGGRGVTGRRAIAGIGVTYATTGPDDTTQEPEPADVVPLAHLRELDTAWLYLLDPGAGTVTVHTGDGHPISRHPLTH